MTRSGSKNALLLQFTHTLIPVLPALLRRTRELFDLNSRPDVISRQLGQDRRLAPLIRQAPGLRVPGAFNGFEMGLRAILGQQVTVKSATTIACRLAEAFGEPIVTPFAELSRLTPAAARLARASVDEIARLGIVSARSKSIIALAQAQLSGALALEGGVHHDPEETIARLAALPGIGQWTAHYIAMRALRWPDAFPENDVAVRNNLGGVSAKQADADVAGMAPLAQLRRSAYLETPGPGRRQTAVGPRDFPGDRGSPAALSEHFHETPRERHAKRHQHQRQPRLRQCLPAWV